MGSAHGDMYHAGGLFTPVTYRKFEVDCPNCSRVIPVRIPVGETGSRYCLSCFTRLLVNDEGNIVRADETTPLLSSHTFSEEGKIVLTCPNCDVQAPPIHISNDRAFAVCPLCKELVLHNIVRKETDGAEGSRTPEPHQKKKQ